MKHNFFFYQHHVHFLLFYCIDLLPRPGRDECDEPDFINIKVRVAWWARGNFSNIATTRQNFCDTIKCENVRPLSLLRHVFLWLSREGTVGWVCWNLRSSLRRRAGPRLSLLLPTCNICLPPRPFVASGPLPEVSGKFRLIDRVHLACSPT